MSNTDTEITAPLSATTTYWGGFSLLAVSIIWGIARFESVATTDLTLGDIDTEEELIAFHDTLIENKKGFLVLSALLYVTLPLVLIHVYAMKSIYKSVFAQLYGIHPLRSMYTWVWIVEATVVCVLLSPALIIATYYSWEFVDSSSTAVYTGYYIQLFCVHYALVCGDAIFIASSMTAIIPWIVLCIACYSDQFSVEFKKYLLPCFGGQNRCCYLLTVAWTTLVVFGAFSSLFDWAPSGFYSEFGYSQVFSIIILVSYVMIAIWMIYIARNADKLRDTRQEYSKLSTDPDV